MLHRNVLMSCDHLPFEKVPEKDHRIKHEQKRTVRPVAVVPDSDDEGSVDEYCCYDAPPQPSVSQPSEGEPLTATSQPAAPAPAVAPTPEPLAGDHLETPDPAVVETTCEEVLYSLLPVTHLPLHHLLHSRDLRRRHPSGHSDRDTR